VKNQIKVLGRNVLFVRAFFLAKANNLAAIEFGKKLSKKKSKKEKGTSKSRLLVRKEKPESKEVWFTYGGR
jgi:hypothetical protein